MSHGVIVETGFETRDFTELADRKTSQTRCLVACDDSQYEAVCKDVAQIAKWTDDYKRWIAAREEASAAERLRTDIRHRFPMASEEVIEAICNGTLQVHEANAWLPMNLLTQSEIDRLSIKQCLISHHALLHDKGATVNRLYWAIVAPNAEVAKSIDSTPKQRLRFLKQIVGLRDQQTRERLAEIWERQGLPPFKSNADITEVHKCLSEIGALTENRELENLSVHL